MFPKRFNFNAHIEEFADFVFRVNGQSFKVHRVTLAGAKEILNIFCIIIAFPTESHIQHMCVGRGRKFRTINKKFLVFFLFLLIPSLQLKAKFSTKSSKQTRKNLQSPMLLPKFSKKSSSSSTRAKSMCPTPMRTS